MIFSKKGAIIYEVGDWVKVLYPQKYSDTKAGYVSPIIKIERVKLIPFGLCTGYLLVNGMYQHETGIVPAYQIEINNSIINNIAQSLKVEHWEDDEYVITLNGNPIGQTLHEREANNIVRWLKTAPEIFGAKPGVI